jgi:hypothetical protein
MLKPVPKNGSCKVYVDTVIDQGLMPVSRSCVNLSKERGTV